VKNNPANMKKLRTVLPVYCGFAKKCLNFNPGCPPFVINGFPGSEKKLAAS